MRKRNKLTAQVTAVILALSLTACGGSNNQSVGGDAETQKQASEEGVSTEENIPTIVWGFTNYNNNFELSGETEVFKDFQEAIRENTGVNVEFKSWPDNQSFELALASGDLPDMFCVSRDYVPALLDGNHVMALDDYLDSVPNFVNASQIRMAAMREYFSKDDHKLYFWTPYVGMEAMGADLWNGLTIRWDYYKELGYPEVKDEDEFLEVLRQAVEKHPETEDGKKVYGVATFSDGTLWGWWIRGCMFGYHNITDAYSLDIREGRNNIINNFMDLESPVWRDVNYYFKANQMGIFDPDSFTMKGDDLQTKATNGQLAAAICSWYGGSLRDNEAAKNPESMAEYLVLPMENQYNWANLNNNIGWSFYHAVSSKTENIDACMKVIDYVNTSEAARIGYMGKEGRLWDTVDGEPAIKQETIDIRLEGGEQSKLKTESLWAGTIGLSGAVLCEDGKPADLWSTPEIWQLSMTPAKKDFCNHYGVEVPSGQVQKLIDEGKTFDKSVMDGDLLTLLPSAPQDITRIDTRCIDIMVKAIPNLVMAVDQAEYEKIQQETLEAMEKAGVRTSMEWWANQEKTLKEFLEKARS